MIRINADLFRIAFMCSSREQTRFYLMGVFVEPHPAGATLVATDGKRLVAILDRDGFADESAILNLSPEALKACKAGRGEYRTVTVDGLSATVYRQTRRTDGAPHHDGKAPEPVAISAECRVDGTYPDWRRVLPKNGAPAGYPAFAAGLLASMCEVGAELLRLSPNHNRKLNTLPATSILAESAEHAAMIRWQGVEDAFGVLMPMRAPSLPKLIEQPLWMTPTAKSAAA